MRSTRRVGSAVLAKAVRPSGRWSSCLRRWNGTRRCGRNGGAIGVAPVSGQTGKSSRHEPHRTLIDPTRPATHPPPTALLGRPPSSGSIVFPSFLGRARGRVVFQRLPDRPAPPVSSRRFAATSSGASLADP